MAIIVPNTASIFSAAASVANSANKWVWVGLATPWATSGCVAWIQGPSTTGCILIPLICSACNNNTPMYGPFNAPCGISAASFGGTACAIVWMKQ